MLALSLALLTHAVSLGNAVPARSDAAPADTAFAWCHLLGTNQIARSDVFPVSLPGGLADYERAERDLIVGFRQRV